MYEVDSSTVQLVSQYTLPTKQLHDLKWPCLVPRLRPAFRHLQSESWAGPGNEATSGQHEGCKPECWPLEVMQL